MFAVILILYRSGRLESIVDFSIMGRNHSATRDDCLGSVIHATQQTLKNMIVLNISADFTCALARYNLVIADVRQQELSASQSEDDVPVLAPSSKSKSTRKALESPDYNTTVGYLETLAENPNVKTVALVWQTFIHKHWDEAQLPVR